MDGELQRLIHRRHVRKRALRPLQPAGRRHHHLISEAIRAIF